MLKKVETRTHRLVTQFMSGDSSTTLYHTYTSARHDAKRMASMPRAKSVSLYNGDTFVARLWEAGQ